MFNHHLGQVLERELDVLVAGGGDLEELQP
jgi:hypothetical protein